MTRINELSVHSGFGNKPQKKFNTETWCTVEMYWMQIRNLTSKNFRKFVISLGEERPKEKFGKFYTCYQPFDFENYFKQDIWHRKKTILDLIHFKMMELSEEEEIDSKKLEEAYQTCLDKNLENTFLFKNKYFRSPDRKHYGGIECVWELDSFKAIGLVLDKNKQEIKRQELLEHLPHFGDFIYGAKCFWEQDKFCLASNSFFENDKIVKKKWSITVDTPKFKT